MAKSVRSLTARETAHVGRKRILVVEDDHALRRVIAEFLDECGYDVVCVDDGASALADLRHQQSDLILLDLIMPRAALDGLGFLSEVARSPAANVPIIVISGLGEPLAIELPAHASSVLRIIAILPKPVRLETLFREINAVIGPGTK